MKPGPLPLALAVLAVPLLAAGWGLGDGLYDDAWIHLRIARHLVHDGVPWFDPHEAVWSSSSTPWTLLLAGLVAVGADTARGLALLGALLAWAAAAVWGRTAAEETGDERVGALVAAAVAASLFRPAVGGMESPLALLAAGAGVWAWRRDLGWCLAPLGLAAMVRLELCAVLALFGAERAARGRWRALLGGAAAVAPFLLFQLWFYPTWIPNTIVAKRVVYRLTAAEAVMLAVTGLPWPVTLGPAVMLEGLAFAVALASAALSRPRRLAAALLGWAVVVGGSYVALRQYVHAWYVPNVTVPLVVGALVVAADRRRVALPALAALAPALVDLALGGIRGAVDPAADPGVAGETHVVAGRRLGAALARAVPDARLMTPEIGGLGDGFPGAILDGAGLVSPAVLRHHPMRVPEERSSGVVGGLPPAWVAEEHPELVVGREVVLEAFERRAVELGYVLLEPGPPLRVWARADLADGLRPVVAGYSNVSVVR